MKKRSTVVGSPSDKKKMPKHQIEKTEGFKQLVTHAGFSKKVADEISKWYENKE